MWSEILPSTSSPSSVNSAASSPSLRFFALYKVKCFVSSSLLLCLLHRLLLVAVAILSLYSVHLLLMTAKEGGELPSHRSHSYSLALLFGRHWKSTRVKHILFQRRLLLLCCSGKIHLYISHQGFNWLKSPLLVDLVFFCKNKPFRVIVVDLDGSVFVWTASDTPFGAWLLVTSPYTTKESI